MFTRGNSKKHTYVYVYTEHYKALAKKQKQAATMNEPQSIRSQKSESGQVCRKRIDCRLTLTTMNVYEKICSNDTLESMLNTCVSLCKKLGLTYRIKLLCTGDLGFCSNKTYDIEVWSPGSKEWLEVSSVSNCTDLQSRRSNTKFKKNP